MWTWMFQVPPVVKCLPLSAGHKKALFFQLQMEESTGDMELIDSQSYMNNPALQNVNNKCFGTITIKIFIFIEINPTHRIESVYCGEKIGDH